jgi:DNA-binding NarL/FixJ family response regulator
MSKAGRTRVLIVASNVIFAAGLADYIEREPSLEGVGSTVCADDAVNLAVSLKPDVVIVDAEINHAHIPTLCRALRQSAARPRVLVMGERGLGSVPLTLIRGGIDGYIFKDCDIPELIQAIQLIHAGELYFPPEIAGSIVRRLRMVDSPGRDHAVSGSPTDREMQVLELMATGASTREIARKLNLSERTVENHSQSLYRKLGVHDRAEAIIVALRRGYVPLFLEIPNSHANSGVAPRLEPIETEMAP